MQKDLLNKRTFRNILILLTACLCVSIFMYYVPKKERKQQAVQNSNYYSQLNSFSDFEKLQGAPLSKKFGTVRSVKLVYQISRKHLYFMNSVKYRYHYDFCREVLGYGGGLDIFNANNYTNRLARDYYLAVLNYYPWLHRYTLEFTSDDRIDAEQIATLFSAVQNRAYMKDSLSVLVSSDYLAGLDAAGKLTIPRIYPSDIYAAKTYQPVNTGESYGILRIVTDLQKEFRSIAPHDIILIDGTPVQIPPCAAIITSSFQTPLSHISVLAHNRNMPAATLVHWKKNKTIQDLIGKPVKIITSDDSLTLQPATMDQVLGYWKSKAPLKITKLRYNLKEKQLTAAAYLRLEDKHTVGNKAANMGELYKISKKSDGGFLVPEGAFAIPFYYYHQHISQPAIQKEIDKLLTQEVYKTSNDSLVAQLEKIRKTIKKQPVDPQLLAMIQATIVKNKAGNSYRFRSSSNAEDAEGFSGAGLYDSKTGILSDTAKPIDKALRNVWASAWSEAAYYERALAGIDQRSMMMGVLAHRNFPEERMNGVAITRNLYRPTFPGFTVNVQAGETSVVAPPDGVVCEQFVCLDVADVRWVFTEIVADYITYSSLAGNKPLLNKQQIEDLYQALFRIKTEYYRYHAEDRGEFEEYALDIEFKFDKNGKLYIKQVRPYR